MEKFFFESCGSALGVSRLRSREKYAGGGEGSRARTGNYGWETRGSVCQGRDSPLILAIVRRAGDFAADARVGAPRRGPIPGAHLMMMIG